MAGVGSATSGGGINPILNNINQIVNSTSPGAAQQVQNKVQSIVDSYGTNQNDPYAVKGAQNADSFPVNNPASVAGSRQNTNGYPDLGTPSPFLQNVDGVADQIGGQIQKLIGNNPGMTAFANKYFGGTPPPGDIMDWVSIWFAQNAQKMGLQVAKDLNIGGSNNSDPGNPFDQHGIDNVPRGTYGDKTNTVVGKAKGQQTYGTPSSTQPTTGGGSTVGKSTGQQGYGTSSSTSKQGGKDTGFGPPTASSPTASSPVAGAPVASSPTSGAPIASSPTSDNPTVLNPFASNPTTDPSGDPSGNPNDYYPPIPSGNPNPTTNGQPTETQMLAISHLVNEYNTLMQTASQIENSTNQTKQLIIRNI